MNKPKNFALIIGSMKSGTTYLYDLMVQHPELLGCLNKEPSFFSNPPVLEPKWERGMSYYDSLWPDWDPLKYKYAIEASTSYTQIKSFPNAAERIATITDRKFKFIYIIRNPIERVRSHMSYLTSYERRAGNPDSNFYKTLDKQTIEISRYAFQLDEYTKRFGRENILILLFEDFVIDPQTTMDKIFEFLKLDSFVVSMNVRKNTSADQSFLSIVHKIRNIIPTTFSFKAIIPKFMLKLFTDKAVANFKLSTEQEEEVLDALRDDIKRLQSEYGVNIERWNLGI